MEVCKGLLDSWNNRRVLTCKLSATHHDFGVIVLLNNKGYQRRGRASLHGGKVAYICDMCRIVVNGGVTG